MDPLVQTTGLTRRLEGEVPVTLVRDVSLQIMPGEFAVIAGPSGSGKSSLLYLLGLLDRPSSGSVVFKGQDTSKYNERELARLRLSEIGFVFQFHFLLPEFTATENVLLPMRKLNKIPPAQMKKEAREILSRLGLENELDKLPKQLSGGQSQRVAIARAIANGPSLILADEPTGNLDTAASTNVQQILRELSAEGRTVLAVTHDPAFAANADRVITIVDGRLND